MRRTSIMTAVALIVMGGGLGHVAPKFGEIFSELYAGELALPALTQIVLALAPFGWVALGVVGALIVIVKDIALPSRKLPNWPYVIALFAIGATAAVALFLPMIVTIGEM
jgi:type II secretory pathway component PulF